MGLVRYLLIASRLRGILIEGIALECQIVDTVPMEAHDEKVDALVTARGLDRIA